MFKGINWLVENLESRRMLSAHHHHAKHAAAPVPAPAVVQAPAPAKRRHPGAAAPAPFQVAGGLPGMWTGGQSSDSFEGTISLSMFQNSAGEAYAILTFNRPDGQVVQIQSQFVVYPDGRFSMQVISAKMALKFSGTIFNHGTRTSSVATMNGGLQFWDRNGTYKSDVVISPLRN